MGKSGRTERMGKGRVRPRSERSTNRKESRKRKGSVDHGAVYDPGAKQLICYPGYSRYGISISYPSQPPTSYASVSHVPTQTIWFFT
jgi:hypothetical protein